jgi:hypothetical protein
MRIRPIQILDTRYWILDAVQILKSYSIFVTYPVSGFSSPSPEGEKLDLRLNTIIKLLFFS